MFWTKCDWCGAVLKDEDYAKLDVTIVRRRAGTLAGRWAEEPRPTLHFCVDAELDLDRMGLESSGYDGGSADCCYERGIAVINGVKSEPPDMGLEWRLVPAGEQAVDTRRAAATDADEDAASRQPCGRD